MFVKLTTGCWWYGVLRNADDIVEMPDAVAQRFIATNQAERITSHESPPIETAALRTQPARGKHDGRNKTTRLES